VRRRAKLVGFSSALYLDEYSMFGVHIRILLFFVSSSYFHSFAGSLSVLIADTLEKCPLINMG